MLANNHYQKLNLKYNPFSFLNSQELLQVTFERFKVLEIAKHIKSSDSCFVEFYGSKGLGKSTHIQTLHSKYLKEAKYVSLKKKRFEIIRKTNETLIIDSFQLLSVRNKLHLLKNQKKLVIASHYSHRFFRLKHKDFHQSINFNKFDLDLKLLQKIVSSKIKLAAMDIEKEVPRINEEYLKSLLRKHPKNLRAIQISLYDVFLTNKKDFYVL